MSNVPADLKYTEEHEWIRTEADGTLTVGITDHAQSTLGDIVFLELPAVGKQVKEGDAIGVVESVKAASDVYSPVSGEIVAINAEAADSPEDVNGDPYGVWLFKIKLAAGASTDKLIDAAAYSKLID
ncbi:MULTISPECIES: glycine cleavage system protein GcvH [Paraburkholderia]|uniref:Glycine cleavage system H protein n=1 Tax=Paraburkholderia megapolitana TaxID=420953 RepID=A0A1I3SBE7_9BURK|nr:MULTISPECIES: glycine cleavage system protein GcvH [Paraburkholderia]MCX4164689.1 glycine cleavage system protein GcvH [Paraburkholderia megapolitana]MDN7160182.1 glycine cleavage system protein GcvH [Paraburkholderia sp. CHISQ3]MDQ6497229.1 glycine cleavage system protein GcvH [Paraburkholderia megapolitana]QDQ85807.1 glycine cleavage system protein GcvH [Paraburkholderia megapolitana]SFJ55312.1 glycine cleavage system H protein [Paraburkholderia megapolitana]